MTTPAMPAEAFPVWHYIEDEMDAREWNRNDLARNMGGEVEVNLIVLDLIEYLPDAKEMRLDGETASRLGKAFGTGPELWINLHNRYLAWLNSKASVVAPLPKGGE